MSITLEQARVLDAVARLGTIQKAAAELGKAHSAVLYSLKALEEQTGLSLLDRSAYRNKITSHGELVLKFCRQLLGTSRELDTACAQLKGGWEPSLLLVYDGVVDFNRIADPLLQLGELEAPTEVRALSAHLNEVEALFAAENADIMVTILPLQRLQIPSLRLRPFRLLLVGHKAHPLARSAAKLPGAALSRHTFIQIRAPAGQLGLSTEALRFGSYFYVNDFATKKAAILKGLGFGWLPDYLVEKELKAGELRQLRTEIGNTHTVYPRLYHRAEEEAGKAARELIRLFRKNAGS